MRIRARRFCQHSVAKMTDHDRLVTVLRSLAPSIKKSADPAWFREPAVRVIDCVLSLNRAYDRFVVPRLDRFEREHPDVRSISELRALIASYPSPHQFVMNALNYRHEARAITLAAVVNWFATITGKGPDASELSELQTWADSANPADHAALHIGGLGLAGFQYLRMLFGANTTKPDIHILRFVEECVGHPVSPIRALQLLENAAGEVGIILRDLDTTIWERSARHRRDVAQH